MFRDLDEKRQQICEAAIELFGQKSFENTKVAEIASTAKVGKGTFYLYFDSKDQLLEFLIEHGIESLSAYVKEDMANIDDIDARLEAAIDAQIEFFNIYRDYCRFMIREIWSYRDHFEDQIFKLKREYITIYEEILAKGKGTGKFKEVDIETISSGLVGLMSISTLHWLLFTDEFPAEEIKSNIKEVFFNGIKN